jgi:hypothetical protein
MENKYPNKAGRNTCFIWVFILVGGVSNNK